MRPPARLTGELLARKGEALPATGMATATLALAPTRPTLVRAGVAASSDGERRQPAGRREDDRVALTLRLDRERHRRLRIFSARHDCSGQDVIVRALDAYLEGCSDHCACLRGETEHCIRN
jgi:hypothetical protein